MNMKLLIIVVSLFVISCTQPKYEYIGQEIVDGKVSAIEPGLISTPPVIYVQNSKQTIRIDIPFTYENKWKVGDSCLLIIKKYKEVEYNEYTD